MTCAREEMSCHFRTGFGCFFTTILCLFLHVSDLLEAGRAKRPRHPQSSSQEPCCSVARTQGTWQGSGGRGGPNGQALVAGVSMFESPGSAWGGWGLGHGPSLEVR